MKKTMAIMLVMSFIFSGILLAGKGPGKGVCKEDWEDYGKVYHMLDLTDEQKDQMQDIHLNYKKKMIPMHADLKLARLELREAFSENNNEKDVKNAAEKVSEARNKLFMLRIDKKLEMRGILTDEQQEKMQAMRPMMKSRMMKHRMHKECNRKPMLHRGCPKTK